MTADLAQACADLAACPGPCNTTWRNTPPDQRGEPIPGQPAWCPPCTARIRHALAELDDLAALLNATADGHREQPATPPRASRHTPSPSQAADTVDELASILRAWEDAYREHKGWPSPPRRGYLATVTTSTIVWLSVHLSGILETPFAADFGLEIRQWHRHLTEATKAGTGSHRKPVPCPRCGLRLLTFIDGTDYVACSGCNRHMTLDEYHEELAAAARDIERTSCNALHSVPERRMPARRSHTCPTSPTSTRSSPPPKPPHMQASPPTPSSTGADAATSNPPDTTTAGRSTGSST